MEFRLLLFLSSLLLVGSVASILIFIRWQVVERLMGEDLLVEEAIQDSLRVAIERSVGNAPHPRPDSLLNDLMNY